jgi:hypothetical protein
MLDHRHAGGPAADLRAVVRHQQLGAVRRHPSACTVVYPPTAAEPVIPTVNPAASAPWWR